MRKLRNTLVIAGVVAAMFACSGCDLFIKKNSGHADLKWYMGVTYENENKEDIMYETKVGSKVCAVALEGEYSEEYGVVLNGKPYINIDTITKNIDGRFYWDKSMNQLLFTNATEIFTTEVLAGPEASGSDEVDSFTENKKCFVNLEYVKKYVDIDYKFTKATSKAPAVVTLDYTSGERTIMECDSTTMRTNADYQNLQVCDIADGTKVTVISTGKNWYKVRTNDGYIGFVPVSDLGDKETKKISFKNDDDTYTHITMDKKICLGWQQIYSQAANNNLDGILAKNTKMNVISPTWFTLADKNGNITTYADLNYVEKAHKKGIQVWALCNDFLGGKLDKKVLTNLDSRQGLVNSIVFYLKSYELDGVNIDFEYISEEVAPSYLQFLRELSIECRANGKVLSIDNYAPSQWSDYYNREMQLKIADYLIIMNYDEHTVGSKEAGSVSSLPFARKSIAETIKQAGDATRIINGIPFYTRAWKMTAEEDSQDKKGVLVSDNIDGNYYLDSEAISMDVAEKAYKDAGVKPAYDEETEQNYVTYDKGKTTYMIWLEDATSIKARMELVDKNNLAGVACWALGQENDSAWKVIDKYID